MDVSATLVAFVRTITQVFLSYLDPQMVWYVSNDKLCVNNIFVLFS